MFAHGKAELRDPNDPITLNQNILSDPKMLTSLMTSPFGDVTQINAMVTAQQLDSLRQETESLKRALDKKEDPNTYKEALSAAKTYSDKPHFNIISDPLVLKRITAAQLKLMLKEVSKLKLHPIVQCKIRICQELLEVENVDSCMKVLNAVMERPNMPEAEKCSYESIIDQASQLAIQLIAEEKVKFQRLQKEQQILIRRQQEKIQQYNHF